MGVTPSEAVRRDKFCYKIVFQPQSGLSTGYHIKVLPSVVDSRDFNTDSGPTRVRRDTRSVLGGHLLYGMISLPLDNVRVWDRSWFEKLVNNNFTQIVPNKGQNPFPFPTVHALLIRS